MNCTTRFEKVSRRLSQELAGMSLALDLEAILPSQPSSELYLYRTAAGKGEEAAMAQQVLRTRLSQEPTSYEPYLRAVDDILSLSASPEVELKEALPLAELLYALPPADGRGYSTLFAGEGEADRLQKRVRLLMALSDRLHAVYQSREGLDEAALHSQPFLKRQIMCLALMGKLAARTWASQKGMETCRARFFEMAADLLAQSPTPNGAVADFTLSQMEAVVEHASLTDGDRQTLTELCGRLLEGGKPPLDKKGRKRVWEMLRLAHMSETQKQAALSPSQPPDDPYEEEYEE